MTSPEDLLNHLDAHLETIHRLTALAPVLDDAGVEYFQHTLELLYLIGREADAIAQLSTELAQLILSPPGIFAMEHPGETS